MFHLLKTDIQKNICKKIIMEVKVFKFSMQAYPRVQCIFFFFYHGNELTSTFTSDFNPAFTSEVQCRLKSLPQGLPFCLFYSCLQAATMSDFTSVYHKISSEFRAVFLNWWAAECVAYSQRNNNRKRNSKCFSNARLILNDIYYSAKSACCPDSVPPPVR